MKLYAAKSTEYNTSTENHHLMYVNGEMEEYVRLVDHCWRFFDQAVNSLYAYSNEWNQEFGELLQTDTNLFISPVKVFLSDYASQQYFESQAKSCAPKYTSLLCLEIEMTDRVK